MPKKPAKKTKITPKTMSKTTPSNSNSKPLVQLGGALQKYGINPGSEEEKTLVAAFVVATVELIAGVELARIPDAHLEEVIEEAMQIYFDYMEKYIQSRFGKRQSTQFKLLQTKPAEVSSKLSDTFPAELKEAHEAFVSFMTETA